jgi:hypothetical protein
MSIIPRDHDELTVAVDLDDTARLNAWRDQFSSPEEHYAALRALAESFGDGRSALGRGLGAWAARQVEQALGMDDLVIETC